MQGPIPLTLPHIPGLDVAGTVDALGDGVTGSQVGDPVIGFLPFADDGASAEYVVAAAEGLAPAPTSIPLADAAALPVVGLTAWQALFEHAELQAGPADPDQRRRRSGRRLCRAAGQGRRRARHRDRQPAQRATRCAARAPTRSSTTPPSRWPPR